MGEPRAGILAQTTRATYGHRALFGDLDVFAFPHLDGPKRQPWRWCNKGRLGDHSMLFLVFFARFRLLCF